MVLNHNGIQTGDFVSQTFPYNNYYHFKTTFQPKYLNVLPGTSVNIVHTSMEVFTK